MASNHKTCEMLLKKEWNAVVQKHWELPKLDKHYHVIESTSQIIWTTNRIPPLHKLRVDDRLPSISSYWLKFLQNLVANTILPSPSCNDFFPYIFFPSYFFVPKWHYPWNNQSLLLKSEAYWSRDKAI